MKVRGVACYHTVAVLRVIMLHLFSLCLRSFVVFPLLPDKMCTNEAVGRKAAGENDAVLCALTQAKAGSSRDALLT